MSNETRWTPGPWEYQQWGSRILDSGKGSSQVLVAIIATNTRKDEGRHNAHLIAAAPTLFKALADLVYQVDRPHAPEWLSLDDAFAALAKARGEQPHLNTAPPGAEEEER